MEYLLFIDESCHLENDHFPAMCLGYIKVEKSEYDKIKNDLKIIKSNHKTPMEVKWSKVSNSRINLYKDLIDYFFKSSMQFRCILVKYKEKLDHEQFNQGSHDNFYYKLIYYLLKPNENGNQYKIYLDIKDTRGRAKLKKIADIFRNYYHGNSPFSHFQHIRSEENIFIQLNDLFIGAITYKARKEDRNDGANKTKLEIIRYLEEKSGYLLNHGTEPWEEKFNIFDHQPRRKS
jgi:hypothetical protein